MGKLGDHSHLRARVVEKATEKFKNKIDNYLKNCLLKFAKLMCKAAVDNRRHQRGAHNYTGNLIGSIVAAVYEKGNLVKAYLSMEIEGRSPIQREMTADGGRHGVYHFREDYDFWQDSFYIPETDTDQGTASAHVRDFITSYKPQSQYLELVVAYTACYAEFVEREHHSLGFEQTIKNFNSIALTFVRCVNSGTEFYQVPAFK